MRPSLAYRLLVRAAVAGARLAAPFDAKLARGVAGRAGVAARLAAWGRAHRDPARPLAWFHAPSVGEGLQARAVLDAFRARHLHWQVAYTHFSPSAERLAAGIGADMHDYLVPDLPRPVRDALDALRPALLVFSKLDVWPELAAQAAARGIPVALVAGTVRPASGRLGGAARALLAPGYAALAGAGAIDADDAERLERLGVPRSRIEVTGDPRADSALARVAAVRPDDPLLRLREGGPMLVAGSTWPADEAVLLGAFARVRAARPEARLLLAPHEPTDAALARVAREAVRTGVPAPVRLDAASPGDPLVLVDRVGVLAALYGTGVAAWVGGGFGSAGLHSVLEPAAWGLPVATGPRWGESRDARLLVAAGAQRAVASAEALAGLWLAWLADAPACRALGEAARAVVERDRGAAERSAAMLDRLVAPRA